VDPTLLPDLLQFATLLQSGQASSTEHPQLSVDDASFKQECTVQWLSLFACRGDTIMTFVDLRFDQKFEQI
jgi:hypothetical protein